MARDDWYRNTDWNDAIASAFFEKLKRARDKSQYLRIQACTLAMAHPEVALELLDSYFALGDNFDMAQAYVDRATACLALGDLDSAISAYEMAVERERVFPALRTGASLDLPYLIAVNRIYDRYEQALSMLGSTPDGLMFPVDRFKHHAARAMILRSQDRVAAAAEAHLALESAALDQSGFRYHPKLGLVSDKHASALAELRNLCDA
jgi:tetratricopeptide (TPR) repeat protein